MNEDSDRGLTKEIEKKASLEGYNFMRLRSFISLVATALVITACFPVASVARQRFTPAPPVAATPQVNVQNYGATGNGTTDDTTAIQNAANAAAALGQPLFFPPGTYLHNGIITFAGIVVNGSGGACVLQAGDPDNTAVVLTGANVSLRNFLISSSGLSSTCGCDPNTATVLVSVATQFTVAGCTIVQGPGRTGIRGERSSIGNINSIAFDGSGSAGDIGVLLDTCFNINIVSNLFQFEDTAVELYPFSSPFGTGSQFITIQSNTFGSTTYPILTTAIDDTESNTLVITSNVIQMFDSQPGRNAIKLLADTNCYVSGNQIWNGYHGIVSEAGPFGNTAAITVTQNVVRNVGGPALLVRAHDGPTAIQLVSNAFGECGLVGTGPNLPVIRVNGPLSNVSTVQVLNNSYQGHMNNLVNYIFAKNLPAANATGNTQTQTTLPSVTGP